LHAEISAGRGINCRSQRGVPDIETPHFVAFFTVAWALLVERGAALSGACRSYAMLLALGAASAAMDVIKSLTTSKPSSSQPIAFGPPSAGPSDDSGVSLADSTPATGFAGAASISPDNISALLAAQSQSTDFNGSDAISTISSAASSAYSAIDQLIQRQPPPVPLSVSV
jgi:hypothetical protein